MFNFFKLSKKFKFQQKTPTFFFAVKKILISGSSDNPISVKSTFDSTKKEIDTSNPLELLLYSLISCENSTFRVIAKERKVKIGVLNFKKAEATYETKGFYGLDPNNKFEKIEQEIEIESDASKEKMEEMLTLLKKRCPVYNMLILAGVEINSNYSIKSL